MKLFPRIIALATLCFASLLFFSAPAAALTLKQAQKELAGYTCGGSVCTLTTAGERTEIVPGAPIYSPITAAKDPSTYATDSGCFGTYGSAVVVGGDLWCIPGSSVGIASGGGQLIGYQPDTSKTIGTQTTVTKELVYNGPNVRPRDAWSITTTTETVDVP